MTYFNRTADFGRSIGLIVWLHGLECGWCYLTENILISRGRGKRLICISPRIDFEGWVSCCGTRVKWTTHCPVQRHSEWTSDSNHCSQSGSRTWGILHYCGPQKKHRKSAGNLGILGKTILELRFDLFLGRFNININVHVCVYMYIYIYIYNICIYICILLSASFNLRKSTFYLRPFRVKMLSAWVWARTGSPRGVGFSGGFLK